MSHVALSTAIPNIQGDIFSEKVTLKRFLSQLRFPHWVLIIYPIIQSLLSRQRSAESAYEVDTSAWLQIAFVIGVGLIMLVRYLQAIRAFNNLLIQRPVIWFTLYYLTAVLSSMWSDRPEYTLYRGCEAFIFLMIIVDTMRLSTSPSMSLRFLLSVGLVVVIIGEFSVLQYSFSISALHNSLVPGAVIPMIFVGWGVSKGLWRWIYYVLIAAVILATSSASYLSLLVGIGLAFILVKKNKPLAILGLVFVLVAATLWNIDVEQYVFWGKTDQQIQSATGRIPVWQWVLEEKVYERPILGFGYGTGELLARLYNVQAGRLRMMHMHNVVMSSLTNLGLLGLMLFLMMLTELIMGLWTIRRLPVYNLFAAGAVAMLLNSLSISSITAFLSLGWICHMLFIMTLFTTAKFTKRS